MKFITGMEHLPYEDRKSKLELLTLEVRRLHGDLIATSQCLKGAYREAKEGSFFRNCSNRTRGNGFYLKEI